MSKPSNRLRLGSVAPLPKTVRERASRFLSSPAKVKYFLIRRRLRRLFPGTPIPVQLSFGSWWLAYDSALDGSLAGGNFENAESRFLLRFLQLGMTVLDIGAHHGYYTLLLSKAVGSRGKVIAFEPSPRERIRLRHHVWLNCCKNVQIESLALGSSNGEAELYLVEGAEDWCNSLRPPTVRASTKIVGVCVGSLDEYISSKGLGPIDFIKLDVEGAELDVLRGAKNLLASGKRPALLTEVYDIRTEPWGYRAHEIVRLLDQAGYLWFAVSEDGSLHRIEAHLEVYDANLVAIPKEQAKNFVAFEDEG